MSARKPLIGITPDRDHDDSNPEALYFVRRNYCDAVRRAGGLPIVLPYGLDDADQLVESLDGLVVTGGMFDIDPSLYGGPAMSKATLKEDRTAFELAVLQVALSKNRPVLGICGGMQLIGAAFGAQMYQDLPTEKPSAIEHMQGRSCTQAQHEVTLDPSSALYGAVQRSTLLVNSLHHQALKTIKAPLRPVAWAPDGVIEAVESTTHSFCLGTQWHPEYGVDEREHAVFSALIEHAREVQAHR